MLRQHHAQCKLQYFPIYRMNAKDLTIRAGSKHHDDGGIVHQVTGGFYHGSYNDDNFDYNVAVLRVCTDLYIRINIEKYVKFLE